MTLQNMVVLQSLNMHTLLAQFTAHVVACNSHCGYYTRLNIDMMKQTTVNASTHLGQYLVAVHPQILS